MKIFFTTQESEWLYIQVSRFLAVMLQTLDGDDGKLLKTAAKVRKKMSPNAAWVSLSRAEREVVACITEYWLRGGLPTRPLHAETQVVASILSKTKDVLEEKSNDAA